MANKSAFDLVSPERLLLSCTADMVTVPGTEGSMGVMAGHSPIVSTLRAGMIDVNNNGKDDRYFIRGGFAEISPAKITVLAEEALPMTEMDLAVLDQRIADTVRGFKEILDGTHDALPEQAFYMVGAIEEVAAKAQKMAAETSAKAA